MQRFWLHEKVIESIVAILKKYEQVERAVIYGSRARGDYRNNSDIDIALFGDELTFSINTKIFYEIDELYWVYKIDLVNMNSLKEDNKFKQNIIREGVEIYAK